MTKRFDILCLGVGCYDVVIRHIPSDLMTSDYTRLKDITLSTG